MSSSLVHEDQISHCARVSKQEWLAQRPDIGWPVGRLAPGRGLDDIGYVQQSRDEMEVLFTLLAERYERCSVAITSNLVFSQWG